MRYFHRLIISLLSGLILIGMPFVQAEEDTVTIPYTITGIDADDVEGKLTGTVTFKRYDKTKNILLKIKEDLKLEENQKLTFKFGELPESVTLGENPTISLAIVGGVAAKQKPSTTTGSSSSNGCVEFVPALREYILSPLVLDEALKEEFKHADLKSPQQMLSFLKEKLGGAKYVEFSDAIKTRIANREARLTDNYDGSVKDWSKYKNEDGSWRGRYMIGGNPSDSGCKSDGTTNTASALPKDYDFNFNVNDAEKDLTEEIKIAKKDSIKITNPNTHGVTGVLRKDTVSNEAGRFIYKPKGMDKFVEWATKKKTEMRLGKYNVVLGDNTATEKFNYEAIHVETGKPIEGTITVTVSLGDKPVDKNTPPTTKTTTINTAKQCPAATPVTFVNYGVIGAIYQTYHRFSPETIAAIPDKSLQEQLVEYKKISETYLKDSKNRSIDSPVGGMWGGELDSPSWKENVKRARANHATAEAQVKRLECLIKSYGDNTPPNAEDDDYTADEEAPLSFDSLSGLLANDSDANDDKLTVSVDKSTSNGELNLKADGAFIYTPNENFNGIDSFTYTVSDGKGGTDTATVTITVNAVNDAPTANNDSYTVEADKTLTADGSTNKSVLANDVDADVVTGGNIAEELTVSLLSNVSNGRLNLGSDGVFAYQPNENYIGEDSFEYKVTDSAGATAQAMVTITVNPKTATSTKTAKQTPKIEDEIVTVGKEAYIRLDLVGLFSNASAIYPNQTLELTGLPKGLTKFYESIGSWSIRGTVTDKEEVRKHLVTLNFTGPSGGKASTTFNLTVKPAKQKESKPLQISLADVTVESDEGKVGFGPTDFNFTVRLIGGPASEEVTVKYTVTGSSNNPADAKDFVNSTFPTGVVTIPRGDEGAPLTIQVQPDNENESDEEFTVTLSEPSSGTIGSISSITGTIKDGDGSPSQSLIAQNACDPNPCQNSGSCSLSPELETGYRCECLLGVSGNVCQTKGDEKPKKKFTLVAGSRTVLLTNSILRSGRSLTTPESVVTSFEEARRTTTTTTTTTTTPTTTPAVTPEICGNFIDDDGDTFTDFADPDCTTAENAGVGNCLDGFDNDNDGFPDIFDPDCVETMCTDFTDNDGDGAIDFADPDCTTAENPGAVNCADGFDNDNDGLVDGADPDCGGGFTVSPTNASTSDGSPVTPLGVRITTTTAGAFQEANAGGSGTTAFILDTRGDDDADSSVVNGFVFVDQFSGAPIAPPVISDSVPTTVFLLGGGVVYKVSLTWTNDDPGGITSNATLTLNAGATDTANCGADVFSCP